jgi:hypothetical protein
MNVKNFLIGTVAGFVMYNILGYLFYQVLFPNLYPSSGETNMMLVTLGCLFAAMMYAFVYSNIGGASSLKSAAINGAGIGGLNALGMNCFMYSNMPLNTNNMVTDIFINLAIGVLTSIAIWFATSKFGGSKE